MWLGHEGGNGRDVDLLRLDLAHARNGAGHLDGGYGIASIDPSTGKVTAIRSGAEKLADLAVATRTAAVTAVRDSFTEAPEVWAGPVGGPPAYAMNAEATHYAASTMKVAVRRDQHSARLGHFPLSQIVSRPSSRTTSRV